MSTQTPSDRELSAKGMRFAIVAARWNLEIVEQLLQGAQKALAARNADSSRSSHGSRSALHSSLRTRPGPASRISASRPWPSRTGPLTCG